MLRSSQVRYSTALLLFLVPRFASAWGGEGHRLIVRLAESMLTPAARMAIAATLEPGESLPALASWADEVRPSRKETEPWHYVDIPLSSSGLDMKRDCPANNCIVGKIEEFRKSWRDPSMPLATRRESLLFLIHFVGDLHEPLHCEDNHDHGGNDVPVRFEGEETNLHSVWDRRLLEHMPSEEQLLAEMARAFTPEQMEAWAQGAVEEWANESFRIAQRTVYGLLPPANADEIRLIDKRYEQMAAPVVELQLEKAAARLAGILNESAR